MKKYCCLETLQLCLSVILLVLIVGTALSGCGNQELIPEQNDGLSNEKQTNNSDSTEIVLDNDGNPIEVTITNPEEKQESQSTFTTSFALSDGVKRTLPFPVSNLTEAGWVLQDASNTLSSKSYSWQNILTKDGKTLVVQLENTTEKEIPFSACQVVMVTTGNGSDETITIEDFGLGDNYDAFVSAMGTEPSSDIERNGRVVSYITDAYKRVEAIFDAQTGLCTALTIQWMNSN